jgi:DNA-binding MarR family transcriptional regulator
MTGNVRSALDALRRIFQALRLSDQEAQRRVGIGVAQLFVLQQLADGEPRSMSELAERTRTDLSSVSTVVRRLVERGLVARQTDTRDRRRAALRITARGRTLLARAPEAPQARLVAALEELHPRRRRELADSLLLVADALGARAPGLFFQD